jgi:hypothetical protein
MGTKNDDFFGNDERFDKLFNRVFEQAEANIEALPVKRMAAKAFGLWAVGALFSIGIGLGVLYAAALIVKSVFMS